MEAKQQYALARIGRGGRVNHVLDPNGRPRCENAGGGWRYESTDHEEESEVLAPADGWPLCHWRRNQLGR